jgi:hypothetical protein
MIKLLVCFLILVSVHASAQRQNRHTPVIQKGFYISFNPHSILEPEQGAVGIGVGYRFNKRFEIWNEFNYLYKGFFQDREDFRNLNGLRNITSLKYFYNNKHGFFVGAEFRIKNYSFDDQANFENIQTGDTLARFNYRSGHTLIGGGAFWGKRFKISANGKFEMEGNIGVGVKQRMIHRKNVPPGYTKIEYFEKDRISPIPDNDIEESLVYFPAIVRFIYHL